MLSWAFLMLLRQVDRLRPRHIRDAVVSSAVTVRGTPRRRLLHPRSLCTVFLLSLHLVTTSSSNFVTSSSNYIVSTDMVKRVRGIY